MNLEITHEVRFPPFSSENFDPEFVPVSKESKFLEFENEKELESYLDKISPPFSLGQSNSWHLKRIIKKDDEHVLVSNSEQVSDELEFDQIVKVQRRGWYITPHPIHSKTRTMVNMAVILLLASLVYLFVSPILSSLGIPTFGTKNIRFGLLDYPVLGVFIVPIVMTPLVLKIVANIGDLRRQRNFLLSLPKKPRIKIIDQLTSGKAAKLQIDIDEIRDGWNDISVVWRVGALPPEREAVFQAQNRDLRGQPPAGMTTEIPNKWAQAFDDGTAGGEDAPMEIANVKGGMFLRPMRIMETGGSSNWSKSSKIVELAPPQNHWPGTYYSKLVKIHWEIIISIKREKGGPLLYVMPLRVNHPKERVTIENCEIIDGRAEMDRV